MLIDSSTSGLPHDQINLVKRVWDSKDFYARRKMLWLETVQSYSNSSSGWRRREGGYFRDTRTATREGAREGAAEQLPPAKKEGEPPSSRGGVGGRSSGRGWGSQRGSRSGNRIDRNAVVCFNCHKTDHFKSECTEARVTLNRIQSPDPEDVRRMKLSRAVLMGIAVWTQGLADQPFLGGILPLHSLQGK